MKQIPYSENQKCVFFTFSVVKKSDDVLSTVRKSKKERKKASRKKLAFLRLSCCAQKS